MEKRHVAALALTGVGVAFAAVNLDEVRVHLALGTWRTPLLVVIAGSIVIGAGLGYLASRARRD